MGQAIRNYINQQINQPKYSRLLNALSSWLSTKLCRTKAVAVPGVKSLVQIAI